SQCYDHFKEPFVLQVGEDGTAMHRFICKAHPSEHVDRSDYEDSTGNLQRHVRACVPDDVPEVERMEAYANGSLYSAARVRYYIAVWCARRHRPYYIVEDMEFRHLLFLLYGKVVIPKRMTVSRDVRMIHSFCVERVIEHFKVHPLSTAMPGRVHICIDGWTSPNVLSFLGITAHWHEHGKLRHIILDFVRYGPAIANFQPSLTWCCQADKSAHWSLPGPEGGRVSYTVRN
ncbi:hypothetical protein BV20DRAFT_958990, partial [Pilatotrama ljubarskyi]